MAHLVDHPLVGKAVSITINHEKPPEKGILLWINDEGVACLKQWEGEHGNMYLWPVLEIGEAPHA